MTVANGTQNGAHPFDEIAAKAQLSAQQVWGAGKETIAAAQQESQRFLDTLARQGQELEQLASESIEYQMKETERSIQRLQRRLHALLKELEDLLDEGLRRLLARLDIPTRDEIDKLSQEIEELRAALPKRRWR